MIRKGDFNMINLLRIISIVVVNLTISAFAETFFVLPFDNCSNNGDGSAATCASAAGGAGAFKGFENVLWRNPKNVGKMGPGDTLYLVGGNTYLGGLTIGCGGTQTERIKVSVYGEGTATLDGGGFITNGNSYVTIDGVRGKAIFGDYNYGIKVINLPAQGGYCYYENVEGGGNGNIITRVECNGSDATGNLPNANAVIYNRGGTPFEASYLWIHGPTAGSLDANIRWNKTGILSFGGGVGTDFTSNAIHHNKIEYIQMDGICAGGNSSIYNNEISYAYKGGTHADGIVIQSGGYAKIYNNYLHDQAGGQMIYIDNVGVVSKSNIYIYNNVLVAAATITSSMINLDPEGGNLDGIFIMNNTFYGNSAAYVIRGNGRGANAVSNLLIQNNIFSKSGGGVTGTVYLSTENTFVDNNSFDYNIYMYGASDKIVSWTDGKGRTLDELRALSPPRETHGKNGIPNFRAPALGNFRLRGIDYLAKDCGADLSSYFLTDKDGITRPYGVAWDIGAYEYNTIIPTPANVTVDEKK